MNEKEIDYVNLNKLPAPKPEEPPTWRDAAAAILALVLSMLFWRVFSLESIEHGFGPGLGVPVFVLAYFAAVSVMLGGRFTKGGAALFAAAMLLAVCCALYTHPGFMILNCFIILLLSAMATFSLSGQSRFCVLDIRDIPEAVRLSVLALFTRIDRPFLAAGMAGKRNRGSAARIVGAVLVTLVLLAVVLALLASADMVFGSFFTDIRARLDDLSVGELLWRVLRTVALALFVASGLCFLREPAPETASTGRAPREKHVLPFLLPTAALDIVYVVFCAVQLRYLFGGADAASMAGGWAEYARTGFFQLVAVAVIDLALCVIGTDQSRFSARGGLALRILCAVLLALTAVILASAFCRMRLYIAAYGMSVLRLMTLWGMLVILAGLLAAGWKLVRPAFSFWKVFFTFGLASWCVFCLSNPAGRVADYNVDAFLDGRLKTVDIEYLRELTADARPALERLEAECDEYDREIRNILTEFDRDAHDAAESWTTRKWSLR